jgi:hypothetical protein
MLLRRCQQLDYMASNMTDEWRIVKDLEESTHRLIEVVSRNLPRGSEEKQYVRCVDSLIILREVLSFGNHRSKVVIKNNPYLQNGLVEAG